MEPKHDQDPAFLPRSEETQQTEDEAEHQEEEEEEAEEKKRKEVKDEVHGIICRIIECVDEISSCAPIGSRQHQRSPISPCQHRKMFRTECSSLIRRVKLLSPLFEEMKESRRENLVCENKDLLACFRSIDRALQSAQEILQVCHTSSKIYLLFKCEAIVKRFASVMADLEEALDVNVFKLLDISDEVREQVELALAQLKRAKARADIQDMDIYNDLMFVLSQDSIDKEDTKGALERLADRLQLKTLSEFKQELKALNSVHLESSNEDMELYEQMSMLLARLKGIIFNEANVSIASLLEGHSFLNEFDNEEKDMQLEKEGSLVIPDDFRCPISLEIMKDPVIVATGQTYEGACIQQWIDAGNKTCPKTQQVLSHTILTPNYVLKSLIAQWCETHGIKLTKKTGAGDRRAIEMLLQKLMNGQPKSQREAAGEIRALAKRNSENRVCIAEAGAIPLLVGLLSSCDKGTQEHAVTALLNLSIHEGNKGPIVEAGAIDPIVEVLKHGSMEARENAAATLFSLSVVDENKVLIGASDAIPALVNLLCDGTLRGKKDAATALFNLSIYQGNKARAVRAMVVPPLMQLLVDPQLEMIDEALAILAVLATHVEGRAAISEALPIPILVNLITVGSSRNKENAAAVLLALCLNDPSQTVLVCQVVGAHCALKELAKNGTARARRKALSLLEQMSKSMSDVL